MEDNRTTNIDQMRAHIEACHAGGLTVKEYCKCHGIAPSKYYYWLKKLQGRNGKSCFVPINPLQPTQLPGLFATIRYPNGVSIELSSRSDISFFKELVCFI